MQRFVVKRGRTAEPRPYRPSSAIVPTVEEKKETKVEEPVTEEHTETVASSSRKNKQRKE